MSQKKIESVMDEYLVKKAPFQIPDSGRKAIVEWVPWIALIGGVFSLLAGWGLWQSGQRVNEIVGYTNDFLRAYGGEGVTQTPDLGVFFYVALLALVVQGALMLYAFPGLKSRKKTSGWNILLYSALISLVYGVFVALTSYGTFSNLFFSALGALIGLYVLAQIKSHYKTGK